MCLPPLLDYYLFFLLQLPFSHSYHGSNYIAWVSTKKLTITFPSFSLYASPILHLQKQGQLEYVT